MNKGGFTQNMGNTSRFAKMRLGVYLRKKTGYTLAVLKKTRLRRGGRVVEGARLESG